MNKTNYIKKTVMLIVIITASVAGIMTSNHYFNKTSVVNYKSLLIYPEPKTFTGFKLINKKNETITISLKQDNKAIEEVVVVGYSAKKRKDRENAKLLASDSATMP